MDLVLKPLRSVPDEDPFEVVERKGLGHPDSICDALAEALSQSLSRFYVERFGQVFHHNVDKVLLCAGVTRPRFGGGEWVVPIDLYMGGRATLEVRGVKVPVAQIAEQCCRAWLKKHLHAFDADRGLRVHCCIGPGSLDLVELYERQHLGGQCLSNDTSCGVGFAPLSRLERTVLMVEQELNDPQRRRAAPERGEDVKVMGTRRGVELRFTIACAMVDQHVTSTADYLEKKRRVLDTVADVLCSREHGTRRCDLAMDVNAADQPERGSLYLTVSGTSAENGDDGQAGRGNRVSGLITPARPMTMEAAAGKNPMTHVGKLYNVVAQEIARRLIGLVPGVKAAECVLVSQIGRPIEDPWVSQVSLAGLEGNALAAQEGLVREVLRQELAGLTQLWRRFLAGEFHVF